MSKQLQLQLKQKGLRSLSDKELLSILFRSNKEENANKVMHYTDYNLMMLAKMSIYDFAHCGVSESEAIYVVTAMELGRRKNFQQGVDNAVIKESKDAAGFIRPMIADLQHEEFWVIYLNRRNMLLSTEKLSQGGMTGTIIDVRLILRSALERHATSIICCHNHPSGNLEPSDSDRRITRQLKDAAAIMDIPMVDHIIVSQYSHYSFADEGLL